MWTNVINAKVKYNEPTLTYDEVINYDGSNLAGWTNLQKNPNAWNVVKAIFNQAFDFSSQASDIEWIFFSPDGLNMYLSDGNSGDKIYQYSLTKAYDILTAAYVRTATVVLNNYAE